MVCRTLFRRRIVPFAVTFLFLTSALLFDHPLLPPLPTAIAAGDNARSQPAAATTAEIGIVKEGPAQAVPGEEITYTLYITNSGPTPAENVVVTDRLPAEVAYRTYRSNHDLTLTAAPPLLVWEAGTVGAESAFTIALGVTISGTFNAPITNTVEVATSSGGDSTANNTASATTVPRGGQCEDRAHEDFQFIYEIQGDGENSPLEGAEIVTEGAVVGEFRGPDRLNGFFLQDPTGDDSAGTSDGIFVYVPPANDFHDMAVQVGDHVRVGGQVTEFHGHTQIDFVSSLRHCTSDVLVEPVDVTLPVPEANGGLPYLERYEGMLVTFPQTLTVAEHYNLGTFGEISLSAGRLYAPNNGQGNTQELNDRRRILLDDGSTSSDLPFEDIPYLAPDHTLRLGDTTVDVTGVMAYAFGSYRVHPTAEPAFDRDNPRPEAPEDVGGTVKVAAFNVLNYFTTFGERGAESEAELDRQRAKIVSAILALDADVIGLMEMENNEEAILDLVTGLNGATAPGTYAAIPDPPGVAEIDQIKQAFIYRPATVTPVGEPVAYHHQVFEERGRPPIAQTFEANGVHFTPIVNHFKSKSCRNVDEVGEEHQDHGQGCWNPLRVRQAEELLTFIEQIEEERGNANVLVIGDLNAHTEEDPIDTLVQGGLVNQIAAHVPLEKQYSYVFFGQLGLLDHALSTPELDRRVTGTTLWPINADEPRLLDYRLDNPSPLFDPGPYRSSDHDPVIVGLDLQSYTYLPAMARGSGTQ